MRQNDFDEILKETELDSAKMILRLTSELKEKDLELAALRTRSFEEIQRNNKAKEAEFEALIQGQEADIRKRETEIARLMVETESRLWQKHQAMLEEAISKHRSELEEERTRLNEEVARKEREVLEQKKNLRLEMETLFKKWEMGREEDFANERKTFIEELKLGRDSAHREAEGRAKQIEELWKEKFAQRAAEMAASHKLELEETANRARQERLSEMKGMSDRLNAEIKKLYAEKEAALNQSRKDTEDALMASERAIEERRNKLENEFALKSEKLKSELARKEKLLEAELTESSAELQGRFSAREKALEEREARVAAEREDLAGFRDQAAETVRRRETELAKVFEDRFALFKASAEEAARARELELSRKYEESYRQFAALGEQKDAAQARAMELARENEELKRLLGEKDAYLRRIDEQEQERTSRLRGTFEEEFSLKAQALRAQLAAGEEAARKNFEERLRAETDSLAGQYRIKEEGLAAQRDLMNAQAAELEAKFMEALSAKERENAENIRKALAGLNAQLDAARTAAAKEQAELRLRAEEAVAARSAEFEARLNEKDLQHEQQLRDRETQAFADAGQKLELENRKTEGLLQHRISDLESRNHILEQNLASARQTRDAGQVQARKLKEELELLTIGLDKVEQEKQGLIQTNLSQAKDLRLALEKEFLDKLAQIEKNYLDQLADALHHGEDKGKALQDEYFKKLAFIKDDCAARGAGQLKEMENTYLERENRMRAALEDRKSVV
jgi:hypothetical protein